MFVDSKSGFNDSTVDDNSLATMTNSSSTFVFLRMTYSNSVLMEMALLEGMVHGVEVQIKAFTSLILFSAKMALSWTDGLIIGNFK
ncbi:hypothetical protein WICPIJ_000012 [Wickerhamomyces pijperi]|uniref:Uncharacterized protein n=1 Tax=Wickerhamomyces pijperi TaxID=599730 RepID=A0A9P8TR87_WICPI|nr:hypothetical protein WICPIJ_000012 [Wickerhamomyces pijperi]